MTLRTKFNLVMMGALTLGLVLALIFGTRISNRNARRTVLAEAAVMMGAANVTIHYTDTQVTPLLEARMKLQFLPQAIPFFAARQTFQTLEASFPGYTFREATLNPTDPDDRATAWEAGIIGKFRADPSLTSLVAERDGENGSVLSYAQPIRVTDRSCLPCHSTPDAAPASMIDVYGTHDGFDWKLGDLVGANIVSVPETVATTQAHEDRNIFVAAIAAIFVILLLLLNVLLHVIVVVPVQHMLEL